MFLFPLNHLCPVKCIIHEDTTLASEAFARPGMRHGVRCTENAWCGVEVNLNDSGVDKFIA